MLRAAAHAIESEIEREVRNDPKQQIDRQRSGEDGECDRRAL